MPQSWLENWPLQDGSQGLTVEEILDADSTNHRAIAGRQKYDLVHTFGNLMLLRQSLNAEISNGSWHEKKTEIQNKALLPINSRLYAVATWDEAAIEARSKDMFQHAVTIWISPE